MNRHPTATLWLLAYSGLTAATHVSIIDEVGDWPNLRHSVMPGESLLDRVRSRVTTMFLKTPQEQAGDVLLFVDADISWQQGDLSCIARRALERNAIVGGIFSKRTFGEGAAIRFKSGLTGEWQIGKDALIPCEYVSNGFIAIPRAIAQAVADTMPWVREGYWPVNLSQVVEVTHDGETGYEFLPEDWSFIKRAKDLGYECYASTYPRLKHHGTYAYRLVDSRRIPPPDEDLTIRLGAVQEVVLSGPALAGRSK